MPMNAAAFVTNQRREAPPIHSSHHSPLVIIFGSPGKICVGDLWQAILRKLFPPVFGENYFLASRADGGGDGEDLIISLPDLTDRVGNFGLTGQRRLLNSNEKQDPRVEKGFAKFETCSCCVRYT